MPSVSQVERSVSRSDAQELPPTARTTSQARVLDERALAAEMTREISVKAKVPTPQIETEEVSSPSISRHTRSYTSRTNTSVRPPPKIETTAKPLRFATFLVFSLLCVSVYAYLAK